MRTIRMMVGLWVLTAVCLAGEGGAGNALAPSAEEPVWELVKKMDFEKEGAQSAWLEQKGKERPASKIERVADAPHSGKNALRITLSPPLEKDADAEKPVARTYFTGVTFPPLEDEGQLRVRLFVKGLPSGEALGEADAIFALIPRVAGGKIVGFRDKWGVLPAADDWTEVTLEAKLPAGVQTLAFQIRVRKPAEGVAIELDDLSFELKR